MKIFITSYGQVPIHKLNFVLKSLILSDNVFLFHNIYLLKDPAVKNSSHYSLT